MTYDDNPFYIPADLLGTLEDSNLPSAELQERIYRQRLGLPPLPIVESNICHGKLIQFDRDTRQRRTRYYCDECKVVITVTDHAYDWFWRDGYKQGHSKPTLPPGQHQHQASHRKARSSEVTR